MAVISLDGFRGLADDYVTTNSTLQSTEPWVTVGSTARLAERERERERKRERERALLGTTVHNRSPGPDGWDQIPYQPGGWILHQPPWSFGFDSQTRGPRENRRTLCESTGFLTGPSSTCPPLSSPPQANSFVIGPAVVKHT